MPQSMDQPTIFRCRANTEAEKSTFGIKVFLALEGERNLERYRS
jgi:hypothetical protein